MPSWPVHIAIARKLNKTLNLGDDFILGNIMPDALNGFIIKDISHTIGHSVTHFKSFKEKLPKTNIDAFLETYHNKLNNPIILGSLTHLLTDEYFNEYTHKHHIKIIDNKKCAILNDGTLEKYKTPWKIKQEDFSNYGNHLIYNKMLGNTINITDSTIKLIKDLNYNITNEDINIIIDKINSIITKEEKYTSNYKMFTQKEIDELFNNCLKYILSFIKKHKEKD